MTSLPAHYQHVVSLFINSLTVFEDHGSERLLPYWPWNGGICNWTSHYCNQQNKHC